LLFCERAPEKVRKNNAAYTEDNASEGEHTFDGGMQQMRVVLPLSHYQIRSIERVPIVACVALAGESTTLRITSNTPKIQACRRQNQPRCRVAAHGF
jgi:hypothetical protein